MTTRSFVDQLGNEISIPFPPRRIVSLVPSQTELLYYLGLDQEVKGITKFCVHPEEWIKSKVLIGGTKKFSFETIDHLRPDLIIGNKEENYQDGIERLRATYPVWMSDIVTLEDATKMISSIGELVDRERPASKLNTDIYNAFANQKKYDGQSVLYLIWKRPWMAAGTETFIDNMLRRMGLTNIITSTRYPVLNDNDIISLKPDYIFLSTEPYPFKDQHINDLQKINPSSNVILVDGEMFSWYGSRLLHAPGYFDSLIP